MVTRLHDIVRNNIYGGFLATLQDNIKTMHFYMDTILNRKIYVARYLIV